MIVDNQLLIKQFFSKKVEKRLYFHVKSASICVIMFNTLHTLKEYVSFPSISTDPKAERAMQETRTFLKNLLESMRFKVEEVPTEGHNLILAENDVSGDCPHIIIYGHYDVQPADPVELWDQHPFEPVEKNGRLYGRGTADNKGPLMAHIAAVARAFEKNPDLKLKITFMIEGEEEIGSPSFPKFMELYKERLQKADLVLLSDTCSPSAEQIVITTGIRGMAPLEVTVHGPSSDLHSGLHGGVLRNPISALSEILASLHSPDGKVNVPGFYDDVIEPEDWERAQLENYPVDAETYRKQLGITTFWCPEGYTPFEALRFLPTLEFNGITGGYQGEGVKTVIPSKASAKISCRLVADQSWEKIQSLVRETILSRAPEGVRVEISGGMGGSPYLVKPPHFSENGDKNSAIGKVFQAAESSIAETFGKKPLYLREGGSIPIFADIQKTLGLDSVMIGLFTPEDNLHAPNESFDLTIFEKAINAFENMLLKLGES